MGCGSSKRVDARVDVYRPAPTSFAVFNVNAIEEPWRKLEDAAEQHSKKTSHVPDPILEKLNTIESDTPHSWSEVSKALENLKPTLHNNPATNPILTRQQEKPGILNPPPAQDGIKQRQSREQSKSFSIHTLEELDQKLSTPKPIKTVVELRKTESMRQPGPKRSDTDPASAPVSSEGFKSVKENMFIVRDRLEREREGKRASIDLMLSKRDPLSEYPEKCPPNGPNSVVLYTTSMRGIRRTYEDCDKVRSVLELQRIVFDERDVALHGEFLRELKELVGEHASVPRLFVKGRYVGGVEEVVELNESGKLGRILRRVGVERGIGRQGCEGCGGARFVPCLECGGSCKVIGEGGEKERCGKCNENGLVLCPACIDWVPISES
ncbi:Glutaredoxin [Dillenia turbinata]|uniref:Glutaredoxin n=1 Tax=Dillenia turbinata TaxID=194707 RepID=A0AAN8ZCL5_9MAGN